MQHVENFLGDLDFTLEELEFSQPRRKFPKLLPFKQRGVPHDRLHNGGLRIEHNVTHGNEGDLQALPWDYPSLDTPKHRAVEL